MPKIPEATDVEPKGLKPYLAHGLDLDNNDGKQAITECPFCGKENKFSVNMTTGVWRCFVCGEGNEKGGGNAHTFIRLLWDQALSYTKREDYEELATERRFLFWQTLKEWGVCKSPITDLWMIPGFNWEGKLTQLYRYTRVTTPKGAKMLLLPTPELGHALHGVNLYDASKPRVDFTEGPWDGMSLWEILAQTKETEDGLVPTSSVDNSLLSQTNVLAVPGCQTFLEPWCNLIGEKQVGLLFDNDHPGKHPKTGNMVLSAGYTGMRHAVRVMALAEEQPEQVNYLNWGDGGFNPNLPNGYDLRDMLSESKSLRGRIERLPTIFERVEPIPADWISDKATAKAGTIAIDILPCDSWSVLKKVWPLAMEWTEGLDRALAAMLATIISTKPVGDQLWIKVVGPPSCGKTTLCEALNLNRQYVIPNSKFTGFHSGFKAGDKKDFSLVDLMRDKTLTTKDGDTLMSSPAATKILGEARDVYDGSSESIYLNGVANSYKGMRSTWILCGTEALTEIDSSELGERFLDCVVMEGIDAVVEKKVTQLVSRRTARNMLIEGGKNSDNQFEPNLLTAMQLTAGYVSYLRENAQELFAGIESLEPQLDRCSVFGQFVAFMRARPSRKQSEKAGREFAGRLSSQLTRFAISTAAVLNRKTLDREVMRRTERMALDTARGRTLEICKLFYKEQKKGMDVRTIALHTNYPEKEERELVRFLRRIGAVEEAKTTGTPRWRLTKVVQTLFKEVGVK